MASMKSNLGSAAPPVGAGAEVVGEEGDPVGDGGREMLEVSPKVVSVKEELAAGGAMVGVSTGADVVVVGAVSAGVMPVPAGTPPEPEIVSVVLLMVGVGVVDDSAEPGTGTGAVETVV